MNKSDKTICDVCGFEMVPDMFIEEEYTVDMIKTGRRRTACNCMICPYCGRKYTVDENYLSGPWHY